MYLQNDKYIYKYIQNQYNANIQIDKLKYVEMYQRHGAY